MLVNMQLIIVVNGELAKRKTRHELVDSEDITITRCMFCSTTAWSLKEGLPSHPHIFIWLIKTSKCFLAIFSTEKWRLKRQYILDFWFLYKTKICKTDTGTDTTTTGTTSV